MEDSEIQTRARTHQTRARTLQTRARTRQIRARTRQNTARTRQMDYETAYNVKAHTAQSVKAHTAPLPFYSSVGTFGTQRAQTFRKTQMFTYNALKYMKGKDLMILTMNIMMTTKLNLFNPI